MQTFYSLNSAFGANLHNDPICFDFLSLDMPSALGAALGATLGAAPSAALDMAPPPARRPPQTQGRPPQTQGRPPPAQGRPPQTPQKTQTQHEGPRIGRSPFEFSAQYPNLHFDYSEIPSNYAPKSVDDELIAQIELALAPTNRDRWPVDAGLRAEREQFHARKKCRS